MVSRIRQHTLQCPVTGEAFEVLITLVPPLGFKLPVKINNMNADRC